MGDNQATMDKFRAAIDSGHMESLSAVLIDAASDDFVEEWPQSGERIVGRDAAIKLGEGYKGATGMSPKMTFRRMVGSGDSYVVEGTIGISGNENRAVEQLNINAELKYQMRSQETPT